MEGRRPLRPSELLEHDRGLGRRLLPTDDQQRKIVEDVYVPARGFMRARVLKQGQALRIVDLEGQQVPDVLLFDANNLSNVASMPNTQLMARRWKLQLGDGIFAKMGQRLATITGDSVGEHVFFGGMCSAEVNEIRYGIEGTIGCRMNLCASMAEYGLRPDEIPEGVFAPFMRMPFHADGGLEIEPPSSGPGDYFEFTADQSAIVAMSNCPSERNPCNGWNPTALRVVIYEAS